MSEILHLNPSHLWKNFFELTRIPRPSKKERKAVDYVYEFGKNLGLETLRDEVGNVIIRKPATPGMENKKGVILQAHVDMVPQANKDTKHDFEKDPIETWIDEGWVKAKGTTLGADNGIGVAAALAVLEDGSLEHGPVEALFTMDEETGMTGAFALKPDVIKGTVLLNLDTEDEGELYIGCAGGMNANIEMKIEREKLPNNYETFELNLKGLKGGHSGMDISAGRGNAIKLLARIVHLSIYKHKAELVEFSGGGMRNAIPREAFAKIAFPVSEEKEWEKDIDILVEQIKNELDNREPGFSFEISASDAQAAINHKSADNLIRAILACPNEVVQMNHSIPGLVETSSNLSTVRTYEDSCSVLCLLRSSLESAKWYLAFRIESVFSLAGAKTEFDGSYPGWKPNPDSQILEVMKNVYNKVFGVVPDVKAVHAGLECGILGSIYPEWDMISFGPTIRNPHSPDEKVEISSVEKFWDYLVATLKEIPEES